MSVQVQRHNVDRTSSRRIDVVRWAWKKRRAGSACLSAAEQAYYETFCIALVLTWSPSKILGYVAPLVCLCWLLVRIRSRAILRRIAVWGLTWLAATWVHVWITPHFVFGNAILWLVTSSAVLFLVAVPSRILGSDRLCEKMAGALTWVVIAESLVGSLQFVWGTVHFGSLYGGSPGDWVEGTIHIGLNASKTYANLMFAANIAFALFAIYWSSARRRTPAVIFGCLALILAQVVHVLLFAVVIGIFAWLLFDRQVRIYIPLPVRPLIILAGSLLVMLFIHLTPLFLVRSYGHASVLGEYPREKMTIITVSTMPKVYPYLPFIGFGPGQFDSRAALFGGGINSGDFPIRFGFSDPFRIYFLPIYEAEVNILYYGSTQQPWYSWLAVYSEWGFGVLVIVLVYLARKLFLLWKVRRDQKRRYAAAAFSCFCLLFFLGFQENYLELAQAILPGCMIAVAFYSAATGRRSRFAAALQSSADMSAEKSAK